MPLTGPPAAPPMMPTPSISQREFEQARRRVRGGLRQAAPVAAGAVLAFLMFGLWTYSETHSVLKAIVS